MCPSLLLPPHSLFHILSHCKRVILGLSCLLIRPALSTHLPLFTTPTHPPLHPRDLLLISFWGNSLTQKLGTQGRGAGKGKTAEDACGFGLGGCGFPVAGACQSSKRPEIATRTSQPTGCGQGQEQESEPV